MTNTVFINILHIVQSKILVFGVLVGPTKLTKLTKALAFGQSNGGSLEYSPFVRFG